MFRQNPNAHCHQAQCRNPGRQADRGSSVTIRGDNLSRSQHETDERDKQNKLP